VSAVQTPGSHDRWNVTASWTPNGAASYSVLIAGTTNNVTYRARDVASSPASLTADNLLGGHEYVLRLQPEGGDEVTASFTAPVLDTTAPDGAYKLDRSSTYLSAGIFSEEDTTADFRITQTRAEAGATRQVLAGDGTAAKTWSSGATFTLSYAKPGTFTPHVLLTDKFANTRDIKLPTVRVLTDTTAPTIHITPPAKPGKVASWRTIRGTASDSGTGLAIVGVFVMEKRGSVWWSYDFGKKTWLKGFASRRKTEAKSKASPALFGVPASGNWRSPVVKDLTKGTLYVEAIALDNDFNVGLAQVIRKIH
jgi:hypothetical protein